MLNFAYGSNLCRAWLRSRVPSAQYEFVARLPGYQLHFHKRSSDGSGKGNAWYTGLHDDVVWGVVVRIPYDEKASLDRAEGLGIGYELRELTVFDTAGFAHAVHTYLASESHIEDSLKPYSWYSSLVVAGAIEHSFPDDYVQRITRHPSTADPDLDRAAKADVVCG